MKMYIINLIGSTDRKARMDEQLAKFSTHLDYEYFDAVNGFQLPEQFDIYQADKHRKIWRSRALTPGEKGVYASNYMLWKLCIEKNEPIIIAEDDLILFDNFAEKIPLLSSLHRGGIDYIRIEEDVNNLRRTKLNDELCYIWDNSKGSTRCYSITPAGAKKLIEGSQKWLCSVDNFLGETYRCQLPSIMLNHPMCKAYDVETTIHFSKKTKVPLIYKLARELYRFYRFVLTSHWNSSAIKAFN